MAKPEKRVNKSKKKLRNSRFPRWTKFVVIGVVALAGITVIVRTFAASIFPSTTTKVVSGGGIGRIDSRNPLARSPITLEACRMSDTPGPGKENRVYFGAKLVISKNAADKLNAYWDRYFPEYHIDGQDVPWAADYTRPSSIAYTAQYMVDNDKPTDTKDPYNPILKPSEALSVLSSGKFDSMGQYNARNKSYTASLNGYPRIKRDYVNSTIYGNEAQLWEKDYLARGARSGQASPFPTTQRDGSVITQNPQNPFADYAIYFGKMPGRTQWSYLSGPVGKYNDAKCKAAQPGSKDPYGCTNDPTKYETINNPNPFIRIDVDWANGRAGGGFGTSQTFIENVTNVFRFKDLPKCGNAPATYTRTLEQRNAEASRVNELIYAGTQKANQAIGAAGIDQGLAQENSTYVKMEQIRFENGVSNLVYSGMRPGGGKDTYAIQDDYR